MFGIQGKFFWHPHVWHFLNSSHPAVINGPVLVACHAFPKPVLESYKWWKYILKICTMDSLRPVWSDKKHLESSLYGICSVMVHTNSTFLWQGWVVAIANRSDVDKSSASSTRWLEHCEPGSQGPLSLQPWCWYLLGVWIWFLTWQSHLPTMDKFSSCLSSKLNVTVYIYILARWRGHFVHNTCVHIDFWRWFFRHDRKELVRHFKKAVYIYIYV